MPFLRQSFKRTRARKRNLLALVIALAAFQPVEGQSVVPREYQIKAAFLYNFARFVEWPEASFAGPKDPIVLGVLGDDPFKQYLDDLAGKEIAGRPISVQRFNHVREVEHVHILFISASEKNSLKEILTSVGGSSTLTVGDAGLFTESGGVISFVKKRNKVRFRINTEASELSNLKISSKLLALAEKT